MYPLIKSMCPLLRPLPLKERLITLVVITMLYKDTFPNNNKFLDKRLLVEIPDLIHR